MSATALIDTNVLVYRYDSRFPDKQEVAAELLREGLMEGTARLAHQTLLEFVAVMGRPLVGGEPLLAPADARREAEELLAQFPVLYPSEGLFRTALRGAAAYGLSWFDAHMWAYAEYHGVQELLSEDFQADRLYGTVRVRDPFLVS